MKKNYINTLRLLLMAAVIAAMPTMVFAASSGKSSHVKTILFVGIAIAFCIDMFHEMRRRK